MFVDLHLHLVPGVDDGAIDLDESLAMARFLVERGWRGAAVTPHIRPGMFDNTPEGLRAAAARLAADLGEAGVDFEVRPGAEHYLDGRLFDELLSGGGLPLGGAGRYLLIEAPTLTPVPGLPDLVFRLRLKGLVPVFAHPERCASLQDPATARRVVEAGAVLQLDLGSLDGAYGRVARKVSRRLLEERLYAVAGTDLHHEVQARRELDRWLKVLVKLAGPEERDRLLATNPARLLAGEEVAA